jgi:hypothetical protein
LFFKLIVVEYLDSFREYWKKLFDYFCFILKKREKKGKELRDDLSIVEPILHLYIDFENFKKMQRKKRKFLKILIKKITKKKRIKRNRKIRRE